jgi:hypothetical protein
MFGVGFGWLKSKKKGSILFIDSTTPLEIKELHRSPPTRKREISNLFVLSLSPPRTGRFVKSESGSCSMIGRMVDSTLVSQTSDGRSSL